MNDTEYLPLSGVCKLLGGAGKSTVRTWIKTRNFPKPIRISQKSALYRRSDVLCLAPYIEQSPDRRGL